MFLSNPAKFLPAFLTVGSNKDDAFTITGGSGRSLDRVFSLRKNNDDST
jgi:hypothetical protein